MLGIDLLAIVSVKGTLAGSPSTGVDRVEKGGRGIYLVGHRPRPGAKIQISALPKDHAHDVSIVEQGIMVRVYDRAGRPADHGFIIKIEAPKAPTTMPPPAVVPEFTTSVRGELGAGEEPPSASEPILATTAAETTETKPEEPPSHGRSSDDDELATSVAHSTSTSSKRRK